MGAYGKPVRWLGLAGGLRQGSHGWADDCPFNWVIVTDDPAIVVVASAAIAVTAGDFSLVFAVASRIVAGSAVAAVGSGNGWSTAATAVARSTTKHWQPTSTTAAGQGQNDSEQYDFSHFVSPNTKSQQSAESKSAR